MSAVAISHGGVTLRQGGFVCIGMTKTIVPFELGTFTKALTPKLMVFVVSLNPVPVIVTRVPTGPASGCATAIVGAEEGAALFVVHADRMMAPMHAPRIACRRTFP